MNLKEDERNGNLTWSAYNASLLGNQQRLKDSSILLPLFRESSKSQAMIKHGLDIIKIAVDDVNKEQAPVAVYDQPLYAIAKQVQWNWKEIYGNGKFVVMMGPLHTEMAAMKTLGDWFDDSGWCQALVEAGIASPGTAQSFLHASHVSRTRYAHQV